MFENAYYRRSLKKDLYVPAKSFGEKLIEHLSNKYIAFCFTALILTSSYLIRPVLWEYIVSALITYFVATLFMRYSLDKGLLKPAKRLGRTTVSTGHAFMALIFIIIVVTYTTSWFVGYIDTSFIKGAQSRLLVALIQTLVILTLLFLDLEFRF